MSDQYDSLRPFITEHINTLTRGRLLEGLKFFDAHTLKPEFSRSDVKLVLLLVRIANPQEVFNADESALLSAPMRQMQTGADSKKSDSANESANKAQIKSSSRNRQKPGLGSAQ